MKDTGIAIYELKTYDKRSWPLTERQFLDIKQKIKEGKKMIELHDSSLIAVSNVAGIERRQMTMADYGGDKKALPEGRREIDRNGPGFKKFVASAKKLNPAFFRKKMAEWGLDAETGEVIEKEDK